MIVEKMLRERRGETIPSSFHTLITSILWLRPIRLCLHCTRRYIDSNTVLPTPSARCAGHSKDVQHLSLEHFHLLQSAPGLATPFCNRLVPYYHAHNSRTSDHFTKHLASDKKLPRKQRLQNPNKPPRSPDSRTWESKASSPRMSSTLSQEGWGWRP